MSETINSFIVYTDIKEIIDDLDDGQVAALFRAMVNYRITRKDPELTGALKYIFIPIRQQMDRDAEKWEATRASRAESGRKGGIESGKSRAKKREANEANASSASSNEANEANEAVNVTIPVTVTDTVPDTVPVTVTATTTKKGGGGECDDKFNIWKMLTPEDIDQIYDAYPESGGFLLDEVFKYVKENKRVVKNPVGYVLGYAKRHNWKDEAGHFTPPWEA